MIPRLNRSIKVDSLYLMFASELRLRGFEGEISESYADRIVQATDNSIYQVLPSLVIFPKNQNDLIRVVRLAALPEFLSLKLFPRGGGTGTNGQSLGDGVIVDISRHMNKILEINVEERWARVESGVVKDQLENALKPFGLFFAPELSTSNRATIGGMINTDASGQGSCIYGKTRNHVLELVSVLSDGSIWTSKPIDDHELEEIAVQPNLVGKIHRVIDNIHKKDGELIKKHFPKLNRSLTGYDLAHIRDHNGKFDLNSILCGAEGSLAFIAEAKLKLLDIPKFSALLVVSYSNFNDSLRDATRLMKVGATSIETIDKLILELAQKDNTWFSIQEYFPESLILEGVNLVEFTSHDETILDELVSKALEYFKSTVNHLGVIGCSVAKGNNNVEKIWTMRKRAVGLLGRLSGEKRPIPFVEDTAVPPENLADYILEFRALLDKNGLTYGMFGHVDAGVLHVRPAIDMKDSIQEKLIRSITDEVVLLTKKYGGVLWGEHGKGFRSEYSPNFFGDLYSRLQEIKMTFDSNNQFNPGKVVAPKNYQLHKLDDIPTRGQRDRLIPIKIRDSFSDALHCNGNGACFNFDPDDEMCPSWKVYRDRRFSPKGRASLMREWLYLMNESGYAENLNNPTISGGRQFFDFPVKIRNSLAKTKGEYDFSNEVKQAMDTCLACKSCAGQCPVKVDVPDFRAKFLAHYHTRYMRAVKDWFIAFIEVLLPLLAKKPKIINNLISSSLSKWVLKKIGLINIPQLSNINLVKAANKIGFVVATKSNISQAILQGYKPVIVVQDAFTSHYESEVVLDCLRFIENLGFKPFLAPYIPNGKPLHVHGFLNWFKRVAHKNIVMLKGLETEGVPFIGIDPAMTLIYRSEYKDNLNDVNLPHVYLIQEWLCNVVNSSVIKKIKCNNLDYILLSHCTEKTNAPGANESWEKVFKSFNLNFKALSSGCCGMSGTFGHEERNRLISKAIYEMSWKSIVSKTYLDNNMILMATGYSCRSQVSIQEGFELPHPIQVLLKFYE